MELAGIHIPDLPLADIIILSKLDVVFHSQVPS